MSSSSSTLYRSTIVKQRVGCGRPSSHRLPPSDFIYGKTTHRGDSFEDGIKNWGRIETYEKSYNKSYKPKTFRNSPTSNCLDSVHGRKSETQMENMKDIVQATFTDYRAYDAVYPIMPKRKKIVAFPIPKATLAYQLAQQERQRRAAGVQVSST